MPLAGVVGWCDGAMVLTAEAEGEGLDPVKRIKAPPPPKYITDRSKALLLLWFLSVTCHVCMYMVLSNMVS